ncbi:MAG: hypothetical protein EOO41_04320, partial [Methanobacteriota archaeon]
MDSAVGVAAHRHRPLSASVLLSRERRVPAPAAVRVEAPPPAVTTPVFVAHTAQHERAHVGGSRPTSGVPSWLGGRGRVQALAQELEHTRTAAASVPGLRHPPWVTRNLRATEVLEGAEMRLDAALGTPWRAAQVAAGSTPRDETVLPYVKAHTLATGMIVLEVTDAPFPSDEHSPGSAYAEHAGQGGRSVGGAAVSAPRCTSRVHAHAEGTTASAQALKSIPPRCTGVHSGEAYKQGASRRGSTPEAHVRWTRPSMRLDPSTGSG